MSATDTDAPLSWGTLTNTCTCSVWDDETGTDIPTVDCFGDCWDDALYSFGVAVAHLLEASHDFVVRGIRLWDGEVSGMFTARNVADFVRGCTVNAEWRMTYQVFADRMEYSLSHHDAMGSDSVVMPYTDDDDA